MPDLLFHHLSLTCRDMRATERFYVQHFGFERARVVPLDGGNEIVFLRGAGIRLELFLATADNPLRPPANDGYPWPGVRNFSFEVDSVDAKLAAMGGDARIAFGPLGFEAFIPGWRSVWLWDPDGNLVQLTQGFRDQEAPPPLSAG